MTGPDSGSGAPAGLLSAAGTGGMLLLGGVLMLEGNEA